MATISVFTVNMMLLLASASTSPRQTGAAKAKALLKRHVHFLPTYGKAGAVQASGTEAFNNFIDKTRHGGVDVRDEFAKFVCRDAGTLSHGVVDVGSGAGSLTKKLLRHSARDVQILGIDTSQAMVREARRSVGGSTFGTGRVRFMQANAVDLHRVDHTFSVGTAAFLFHELPREAGNDALRAILAASDATYIMDVSPSTIDLPVHPVFRLFEPFVEEFSMYFESQLATAALDEGCLVEKVRLPAVPDSLSVWKATRGQVCLSHFGDANDGAELELQVGMAAMAAAKG